MLNLTNREHVTATTGDTRKSVEWMLIDAAIIGAIAAFASMGSGGPTWEMAFTMFKAFGLSFFMQLAVERGLKRPPETHE